MAKLAAVGVRVPASVRGSIAGAQTVARQLAVWLGRITAAASNWLMSNGTRHRDSRPGPRQPRAGRGSRAASAPEAAPRRMRHQELVWARLADVHDSHRVRVTGEVVWCDKCAAYALVRMRLLARECPRRPADAAARARREALRAGRHPVTGEELEASWGAAAVLPAPDLATADGGSTAAAARLSALRARVRAREAAAAAAGLE